LQAQGQIARLLMAGGREQEADRVLETVLRANPRDNTALMLRAQRSMQKNDPAAAIIDLRAVLKDQPDSVELTTLLARAHLANRSPDLARDTLARAVSQYPKRPQFRYLLAGYLASQKDIAGAIREIDEILRERPGDTQALQAKADLQVAAGNAAAAEAALRQIVKAAPESPLGYFRLAQLFLHQKKYGMALEQLNTAAAKAPENPEVLGALAKLLIAQKRPGDALSRLRQAAHSRPENAQLQVMLGEMLAAQGKLGEAEPVFRKAAEMEPRLEAAHANLAQLLLARGDAPGAEQAVKAGLAASPHSIALGGLYAELLEKRGDYNGAIAQYDSMLAVSPANDVVTNNLVALISDHRDDSASLRRAAELSRRFEDSRNPVYLDTVGWAAYRAGDVKEASEALDRAAKATDDPVIHYHLAIVLRKMGKDEAARAHLKKAVDANVAFPGRDQARALLGQS
jgi:predicted Zn-dependent protease